jgi:hypothetical protein
MQNSYLWLTRPHPLLAGLDDAPRIINSVQRVHVAPLRQDFPSPVTLVPSYPDLPMEHVFTKRTRPTSGWCTCATSARAGSSTSPATSTAPSGK